MSAFNSKSRSGSGLTIPAVTLMILIVAVSSCLKKESFPIIPEIAYQDFTVVYDTSGTVVKGFLTISFRDGDGDIGLLPADTFPPYNKNGKFYYNYVIDYYEKQNGVFVKLALDPPFSARIPLLTPDYVNKAIKGIIVDTLTLNPKPVHDTIKLKFFIYDRALHQSNVDSTPPIILRRYQ